MKVNMTKLVDNYGPPRPKKYGRQLGALGMLALCLSLAGGGMLYNGMRHDTDASADEIYDVSLCSPSFTVQHVADVSVPDIQAGDGAIPVLTPSGNGYFVSPGEDGALPAITKRMNLYDDYTAEWNETDSLALASFLNGTDGSESPSYRLSEVWFGKNPQSVNRSDFLVLTVPIKDGKADLSKIDLTNNPAHPGLSVAEGGEYKASGDGTYTICIQDGDVIRLVFAEKDDWAYRDVDLFDYDVTDGGYYLEDDYFHREGIHENSGMGDGEGPVYIDALEQGIHVEENYRGTGTKIAFGADGIETGLADESITGELNTPNVWNYDRQEETGGTGVTPGLVKGVSSDGQPMWADGISAPSLFSGTARGKTDHTDSGCYFTFARKGASRTLSGADTQWGEAASSLEKLGAPFWLLDDSPEAGADGHDILWGDGDENLNYYRSNDKYPEVLPESADGENHNHFFGFSYQEDFTLEPGYTGPLSFFGYSDDDLWAFAVQVDDAGKPMPETAVQAADLGGVHDDAGYYCDLWASIKKVPYGEAAQKWRLYVFWLERDGTDARCGLTFSLPDGVSFTGKKETGSVVLEASDYNSVKGEIRTFRLDDGTHDRYLATFDDGIMTGIVSGEDFRLPSGSFVSIDGMPLGQAFTVTETGRESVWHSSGDGFEEGNSMECTVSRSQKIQFMSTVNKGTLTIAIDAPGAAGTFGLGLNLENTGGIEITAMDGNNAPLGSRMTDEDGNLALSLMAGDILTLCNLPDGAAFTLSPVKVPGYKVSEIMLDNASAQGSVVNGHVPAYVIYRYTETEKQGISLSMEQSVTGDWGTDEITLGNGALLSYKVTVVNPDETAVQVHVEDVIPDGLSIVESLLSEGGAVNGQAVSWDVSIPGGKAVELRVTCEVTGKSGSVYENRAVCDGKESNTVKSVLP